MHDHKRAPGRGPTTHDADASGGHGHGHAKVGEVGVGKTTLTEGLDRGGLDRADPQILLAEVQKAATAGHVRRALELMSTVARPQQAAIAEAIGPGARAELARDMPTDIGESRDTRLSSDVLFDHTPDAERSTLERLLEARYRIDILGQHTEPLAKHGGKPEPTRQFDALGLRRLWDVLQKLPAGQVANNWALAKLARYHDTNDKDPTHAHGVFGHRNSGAGEIDISYEDSIIEDGGTTDHDRPGDPLHGVNRFDEVARHEVGHAVDRELGWPSFSTLSKTEEAGEWEGYYDEQGYRYAAEKMVSASAGAIDKLAPGDRAKVVDAMVASMLHSDTIHFRTAIDALHDHHGLKGDPVYRAMTKGLASQNPWLDTHAIGGRHYHQAYKGTDKGGGGAQWTSYTEKAYRQHRVSEYQFRAIQEWFAEAYAAFYTPGDRPEDRGIRLAQKLPNTHAWFVENVDNKRKLAKQAKAARKDDHAPKKP